MAGTTFVHSVSALSPTALAEMVEEIINTPQITWCDVKYDSSGSGFSTTSKFNAYIHYKTEDDCGILFDCP